MSFRGGDRLFIGRVPTKLDNGGPVDSALEALAARDAEQATFIERLSAAAEVAERAPGVDADARALALKEGRPMPVPMTAPAAKEAYDELILEGEARNKLLTEAHREVADVFQAHAGALLEALGQKTYDAQSRVLEALEALEASLRALDVARADQAFTAQVLANKPARHNPGRGINLDGKPLPRILASLRETIETLGRPNSRDLRRLPGGLPRDLNIVGGGLPSGRRATSRPSHRSVELSGEIEAL